MHKENPIKSRSNTQYIKTLDSENIGKMAFTKAQEARIVTKYIRTESLTVTQR